MSERKIYYGTKLVKACPEEKDGKPGYRVEYPDGYVSWSPRDTFEAAYRTSGDMSFGHALEALKSGERVSRKGWNGKGMWLRLVHSSAYEIAPGSFDTHEANPCNPDLLPFIGMKTVDDKFVPWLASQTDALADDWCIV